MYIYIWYIYICITYKYVNVYAYEYVYVYLSVHLSVCTIYTYRWIVQFLGPPGLTHLLFRLQGFNNALHWSCETIRHHPPGLQGRPWAPPMTMEPSTAGRSSVPVAPGAPVLHWVYCDCAHWERMQKTNSGDSKTTGCWVYSSHSAKCWDPTSSRSSLPEADPGPKHLKHCRSRINHLTSIFICWVEPKNKIHQIRWSQWVDFRYFRKNRQETIDFPMK